MCGQGRFGLQIVSADVANGEAVDMDESSRPCWLQLHFRTGCGMCRSLPIKAAFATDIHKLSKQLDTSRFTFCLSALGSLVSWYVRRPARSSWHMKDAGQENSRQSGEGSLQKKDGYLNPKAGRWSKP